MSRRCPIAARRTLRPAAAAPSTIYGHRAALRGRPPRSCNTIGVEVRRLEHVVNNLFALSRLQAGAVATVPEAWTVQALIYGALDEVSADTDRVAVSVPTTPAGAGADDGDAVSARARR